jgi:hypothetical protein
MNPAELFRQEADVLQQGSPQSLTVAVSFATDPTRRSSHSR